MDAKCVRCGGLHGELWDELLCYACSQWYCFNCGNDLDCPDHKRDQDGR